MFTRKQEIIFEAKVEYTDNNRRIRLDDKESHIAEKIIEILTVDLPNDINRLFGIKIHVNIKGTRYGSLSVFFGVILTTYSIIAGYKGFYESIKLIREQAEDLLNAALNNHGNLNVEVFARYPTMDAFESSWIHKFRKYMHDPFELEFITSMLSPGEPRHNRRDGFFISYCCSV